MRRLAGTLLTLVMASSLWAQQNAASAAASQPKSDTKTTSQPASSTPPHSDESTSTSSSEPDKTSADNDKLEPLKPGQMRVQPVVIQSTPLHVPLAVGPGTAATGSQKSSQSPAASSQPSKAADSPAAAKPSAQQAPSAAPSKESGPQFGEFRSQPVVIQNTPLHVPVAVNTEPAASAPAMPSSARPGESASSATRSSSSSASPAASETSAKPEPPETGAAPPSAGAGTMILPNVSKKEAAEAKKQFDSGVKLKERGKLDEAFTRFTSASELDPRSIDYVTAREFTREQLAYEALQRGNQAMLENKEIVAMAEFRRALEYDPSNDYALQRLRDSIPQTDAPSQPVSIVEQSLPIELKPSPQHHDFHFRGDVRGLLTEITRAYGIHVQFDDSVQQKRVFYDIQDVNFATAMQAATAVTKTFWVALTPTQVLVLADTVENRRNFERMGLRTFYLPDLSDQQLAEMTNSLRILLNLRYIAMEKSQNTITMRAELPLLEAADKLIRSLTTGRPEVLLDLRIYAVATSLARSLGTALPTQFTMFNISPALLGGLGPNATNLINQLIASGGINAANSSAISALLGQLQNSTTSSILSQPFVIFGGGLTLFGLTGGNTGITPTFSLNTSDIKSLEHLTLRASHDDPAVAKIGERYPIINATFAPIYNTSAIASVIGNGSYIAPIPSFNFEDLGLNLKATPYIHGDQDVTLKLELQLRSLGTQTVNGIPVINNREYNGQITVKDGESSVVTGLIDMNDTRSINGYPFLGRVPGLTYGASVHDKNVSEDELLVVITPHIVRLPEHNSFAVELPPAH